MVSFVTKSGKSIEFTSSVGSSQPNYEGSKVKVLYDPTNPNKAEINGMYPYVVDPTFLSLLGAFFGLSGFWTILKSIKEEGSTGN